MSDYMIPNWPAPKNIRALTTSLSGGVSQGAYYSNNLALHVDDDANHVIENRQHLRQALSLPGEPAWLNQTHSTRCIVIEEATDRDGDAAVTRDKNQPLVILTADCLPIILCDQSGQEIAAIHAGWRGLLNGVIQNTLKHMQSAPLNLLAWIGPAICQDCYEVGESVKQQFLSQYPFVASGFLNRHANLAHIAEMILHQHGVKAVSLSGICSFEQKDACYSYRRAPQTGRMGTLIWFDNTQDHAHVYEKNDTIHL